MMIKTLNKLGSKTFSIFICIIISLSLMTPCLVFAADVSVIATPDSAYPGDEVTVSGTADPEIWITIKVLESSGSIVYLNSILSNSDGGYSDTFKVPDVSPGVLQVVAGYGSNTTTAPITVTGSSGGTSTSHPTPAYQAVVSRADTPETTLPVSVNLNTGSSAVDMETLANNVFDDDGITVITMPSIPNVTDYTLKFPTVAESTSHGQSALTFSTDVGSITIPDNMFSNIPGVEGKKLSITIGQGNKSTLSDEEREAIDDRPLVQLTFNLNGEQARWNNPEAPVSVSIPYTPTAMELLAPEHIVIWYIDGQGNAVSIPNGRYDPATGTVTFTTTHFSYYAVAYVKKTFSDLSGVEWARKSIEIMASKGIINGTSTTTYSPVENITRADYLVLLIKTLGLTSDFDSNFDDIKPSDYYYEAMGIAKKIGIAEGIGNNLFNPKGNISRQDMIVMTARALENYQDLVTTSDTTVLDEFSDKRDIFAYAIESLATMVKEGLISGSGDKLNPLAYSTRAEAAVFLYRIYNE
ncbi:hypothetical protein J2Z76_002790 [Sedimentibacter acidaminivorans]|uniref:SLH domain-containing protein n=1 Tax=Sedimentibacter acidaminivorans TaxID=913099 RepID=A0ABS4GGV2_9FIRM|nr:S-layer homology domain-containing protein [Sedimentibacter acidaminivorans]MBP1926918.1 hypothetical protein [Sedimentibacter acidaminivorans]